MHGTHDKPPTTDQGPQTDPVKLDDKLRILVRNWVKETHTSQTKLARAVGSNPTSISRWLAGNPLGDVEKLERSLREYFDNLSLSAEHAVDKDEHFIDTDAARAVQSALERIHATRDIGVIYGPAGIGKSEGIRAYRSEHVSALGIRAFPWTGGCESWAMERKLLTEIGARGAAKHRNQMDHVTERLAGSGRLIIVDDAHELQATAAKMLVLLCESTGCPLAMVGNASIIEVLRGRTAQQREIREQVISRVGLRIPIGTRIKPDHVRQFVEQYHDKPSDEMLAVARRAATGPGHLRTLDKALRNLAKLLDRVDDDAAALRLALAAVGAGEQITTTTGGTES